MNKVGEARVKVGEVRVNPGEVWVRSWVRSVLHG